MPKPISLNWGPELHGNSYQFLLEDTTFPQVINLSCGYSLGQPEMDKTDPIKMMFNCEVDGVILPRTKTIRGALIREATYPLLLPQGKTAYSPLFLIAGNNCERTVFLKYLCPPDSEQMHVRRFKEATFDEAEETSVLVEGVEGAGMLTAQSMMHTFDRTIDWYISAREQSTDAVVPLHAIAFEFDDCPGCSPYEHRQLILGGDEAILRSTDAGGSTSALTVTLPTDALVEGLLVDGNLRVAVFSVSTTDGGIRVSRDGGTSWSSAGPSTIPFYDVFKGGSYYYAVGAEGAVYWSSDLSTWTAITTPFASGVYSQGSYDPDTDTVYIAGTNSGAGKLLSVEGLAATDLSSLLPGSPTALYAVKVLAQNHVAVGGASGYFAYHSNIALGTNFTNGTVGSGNIRAIKGDLFRTVLSSGAVLYIRDIAHEMDWDLLPVAPGTTITGEFYDIAEGKNDKGVNYFAAVTALSEIVLIYPSFPQAI